MRNLQSTLAVLLTAVLMAGEAFGASNPGAIAAPKGTPAVIINRLNAEIAQFMELPDVQEKLVNVGLFPLHSTPARVTELVKIGNQQMAKVVKAAGIKPE